MTCIALADEDETSSRVQAKAQWQVLTQHFRSEVWADCMDFSFWTGGYQKFIHRTVPVVQRSYFKPVKQFFADMKLNFSICLDFLIPSNIYIKKKTKGFFARYKKFWDWEPTEQKESKWPVISSLHKIDGLHTSQVTQQLQNCIPHFNLMMFTKHGKRRCWRIAHGTEM